MFEVLLLTGIILLLPLSRGNILFPVLGLVLVVPGMYATWTGAPFVPTSRRVQKKMLELANIKRGQKVYDLGCGDGRLVFAAAKKGAKAIGYELSIPTFAFATLLSLFRKNAKIKLRNFWKENYADADVIFCYLLVESMQTFKKIVWPQLKPGCKVISNAFRMKGVKATYEDNRVVMYVKE